MKVQVSVTIDKSLWTEFKKLAKKQDRSAVGLLRFLIRKYIDDQRSVE